MVGILEGGEDCDDARDIDYRSGDVTKQPGLLLGAVEGPN